MVSLQTVSCMIESAAKPTAGSRLGEEAAELRVEVVGRSHTAPVASKRCSTTGAATSATMPPYTTKTWPVIRSAAGEAR